MHMAEAARAAFDVLELDARPFVITRAGFAGVQRHAMVWTGDNHSIWAHLEQGIAMCLGMGLSGVPFVGPDVGGFSGDCTPELLVRWTQAGALTPFFRNHSALGTRPQEPWAFGPATEALVRAAIELRYRLLPYLYTCFRDAAADGLPIMRPMMLDHDDPAAQALADQFMVGRDLLVAPVCRPGATHRMVWFPPGAWYDFHTGEAVWGPGFRVVEAPLARLPLYVRGGTLLPVGPVVQHTDEPVEELELRVFPGPGLEGGWYDDDGATIGHVCGAYDDWRWIGRERDGGLEIVQAALHHGYRSPTTSIRVAIPRRAAVATWEGTELDVGDGMSLVIPLAPGTLRLEWA
jgi:alpha-glucosidase